jgi:hypothetical protein
MAGQNHHFSHYAPTKIPYAIDRYVNETSMRIWGYSVLPYKRRISSPLISVIDFKKCAQRPFGGRKELPHESLDRESLSLRSPCRTIPNTLTSIVADQSSNPVLFERSRPLSPPSPQFIFSPRPCALVSVLQIHSAGRPVLAREPPTKRRYAEIAVPPQAALMSSADNSKPKVDLCLRCGCRRHPHVGCEPGSACGRRKSFSQRRYQ